ncbi:MAG: carbon-nitrogen hydrolase family protein [Phycisphaerales bacterium]|nr:carbon-nitrogen hydrolase family protein [Phycisphaerales bacterium]
MAQDTLRVALIRDVFYGSGATARLKAQLRDAKSRGAELAVLPELACNEWRPWTKEAVEADAEPLDGPRCAMQAAAAREVGIGLVGAAIIRDETGRRENTAIVFDAKGERVSTYAKIHLPEEPGFWETSHYEPGRRLAPVVSAFGVPFAVQICSDMNRPQAAQIAAAQGAMAILGPRATESRTFERWKPVWIATARTNATYVLSVDRPGPEHGVLMGQPTIAVDPDGQVLLETMDSVAVVDIKRSAVEHARTTYPGYLARMAELYSEGWARIGQEAGSETGLLR